MYQFFLELKSLFSITCVWSILLFSVIWAPHVVFKKFKLPAVITDEFPPFTMLDGIAFVTYLCIGNATIAWTDDAMGVRNFVKSYLLLFFVMNFLVFMIWVMNLRFMKFNNITEQKGRAIYQFVLYPLSVLSVTGVSIIGMLLLFQVFFGTSSRTTPNLPIAVIASITALGFAATLMPLARRLYQKHCLTQATLATDMWKPFQDE
jgi:hypothetical protein